MMSRESLMLERLRNRARGWRALEAEMDAADLWVNNVMLQQEVKALREQAAAKPEEAKPEGRAVLGQTPAPPEEQPHDA